MTSLTLGHYCELFCRLLKWFVYSVFCCYMHSLLWDKDYMQVLHERITILFLSCTRNSSSRIRRGCCFSIGTVICLSLGHPF